MVTEPAIACSEKSYDAGSWTIPHHDDMQQALTPWPSLLEYRDPSLTERRAESSPHDVVLQRKEAGDELLKRGTSSTLAERVRKHVQPPSTNERADDNLELSGTYL